MNPNSSRIIALLSGPDQKGLVAKVASWIYEREGNIIHADQHRDQEEGVFFQRVEWAVEGNRSAEVEAAAFRDFGDSIGMRTNVAIPGTKPKVALFVSKANHCFHDLVLRWKAGDFPCDINLVISNHETLKPSSEWYGIPFEHVPVTKESKSEAEARQLSLLRSYDIDLVIMARYMQVLSAIFLDTWGKPVINIHHSFLPAFAGARPYHQAHKKGVKLIGATAHYATAELDQGPIIHQAVAQITHRNSVQDLIRKGRDLEKMTLAQAVSWHLENRILVYENKTVVFD
ncbi:formyltetrahydrofolate deformylase [Candidatus Pelagisphaera phototrophica]|uniref:formyltetrahydrofolate deformylase n=1 Tax=Candidatus Pelagisphaera phototrophica TaxID=2684113 RepID=UPI0019D9A449|nr:formyltetrahydrofolate deformylase [Candidatus Pelagisphaera phototrophica]QXD32486.1 formyltetrahydrofolate deformylase [Candidatus Pelagisphaera phototrophica]